GGVDGLGLSGVAARRIEPPARAETPAQALPQGLFLDRDALIARVGEHEKIERMLLALTRERRPGRGESRPDAHRILVVDRHHERDAGLQRAPGELAHVDPYRIAPGELHSEPRDRSPQCTRDPPAER